MKLIKGVTEGDDKDEKGVNKSSKGGRLNLLA